MKLSCPYADKIFIAYFVASYLNAVAEAGKAKRPVLMAAKVAGKFPSGGPVSRVMEV